MEAVFVLILAIAVLMVVVSIVVGIGTLYLERKPVAPELPRVPRAIRPLPTLDEDVEEVLGELTLPPLAGKERRAPRRLLPIERKPVFPVLRASPWLDRGEKVGSIRTTSTTAPCPVNGFSMCERGCRTGGHCALARR
jgi:hypothetical protein